MGTHPPSSRSGRKNRRRRYGLIGLILSLFGVVTIGILTIPAAIFCVIGLRRRVETKLSLIGLLICMLIWLVIGYHLILLLSMGSSPNIINLHKYNRICERSRFWLDFDRDHIEKVESESFLHLGGFGSILFRSPKPDTYCLEDIISFAEANKWLYRGKAELAKADIIEYVNPKQKGENRRHDKTDANLYQSLVLLFSYNIQEIWIQDTCTVLAFDTKHYGGIPSYVFIKHDGSEIVVRVNHTFVPDTSDSLILPSIFKSAKYADENILYWPL